MNVHTIYSQIVSWTIAAALVVVGAAIVGGCSSGNGGYVSMPAPASAAPAPGDSKIAGVFEGTSVAYCNTSPPSRCNAQQNIRITLIQGSSGLTGSYQCSYGNMVCYNMNQTGKVSKATISGNQVMVRVQMPDGTSCLYNARMQGDNFNGGYSCYGGGSLIETGMWRGKRVY